MDAKTFVTLLDELTTPELETFLAEGYMLLAERIQQEPRPLARQIRSRGGSLSFGYREEDGCVAIDQAESHAVRLIFLLHKRGTSVRLIADYLNRNGIPSPHRSTAWGGSSVHSILSREAVYRGTTGCPAILLPPPDQDGQDASSKEPEALSQDRLAALVRLELKKKRGGKAQTLIPQISDPIFRADCELAHQARIALGKRHVSEALRAIEHICDPNLRQDREAEIQDYREREAQKKRTQRQASRQPNDHA